MSNFFCKSTTNGGNDKNDNRIYHCFNKGNEYAKRKTRNITNAGFCGEIKY